MKSFLWIALDAFLLNLRNPFYVIYTLLVVISVVVQLTRSEYASTFSLVVQWVLLSSLLATLRAVVVLATGYMRLLRIADTHNRVADEWEADGRRSAASLLRAYVRGNERVIDEIYTWVLGPRASAHVEKRSRAAEESPAQS